MKKIKTKYKIIFLIVLFFALLIIEFPYYIESPGGISSLEDKIEIDGYKSKGSFNLSYVSEYSATVPLIFYSFFNKNFDIVKQDEYVMDGETVEDYSNRDSLFMEEAISSAIYVAFKKANKNIEEINNKLYVLYNENENSDLKVNDEIIEINGNEVKSREDIENLLKTIKSDKVKIKVKRNEKISTKQVYLTKEKKLGIIVSNIKEYKTNPKLSFKIDKNESGSSGGLMMALSIYNSLIKEDLTNGLKIVGTGTIDYDGNVGEIAGVKYKLISAKKAHANLFFVPFGDNCKEAKKLNKKYNYKINIKCVKNFDEAVAYLNS